jgi:hypothetical protein
VISVELELTYLAFLQKEEITYWGIRGRPCFSYRDSSWAWRSLGHRAWF